MYLFAMFLAMVVVVLTYLAFDYYINKRDIVEAEDLDNYNEDVVTTMQKMRQRLKEHLDKRNKK